MKTLKLKKLILSMAIVIIAFISGYAMEVALAEEINYCTQVEVQTSFTHSDLGGRQKVWYTTASNVCDDNQGTWVGCYRPGRNHYIDFVRTVMFTETTAEIKRIEYSVSGYPAYSPYGAWSGYLKTSLYYNGSWHEIDSRWPLTGAYVYPDQSTGIQTTKISGTWNNVEGIRVHVYVYAEYNYLMFYLRELRAFGHAYTISGHARDKNNDPVIGATITLTSSRLTTPINLTTDGTGYYESGLLSLGTYTITGSHTSYSFVPQEVTLNSNLDVSFYTITGYVKRYMGEGINDINVTITGGSLPSPITLITRDAGNVLELNGINDYVDCGKVQIEGQITVSAWLKPNAGNFSLVNKGNHYSIFVRDDLYFAWADNTWSYASFGYYDIGLTTGAWQHLAVTKDTDNHVRVYLDGTEKVNNVFGSDLSLYDSTTFIGGFSAGNTPPDYLFNGSIDDVCIYNRALTPTEITTLKDNGPNLSNPDPTLVAYYPFNGNANDLSTNGNHGRMYGGVITSDDSRGTGNPGYYEKQGVGNGAYTIEATNP